MSEDLKEAIITIVICVFCLVAGVVIGCDAGMSFQKREAVKAGAAKWGADQDGRVKIEYLKPQ